MKLETPARERALPVLVAGDVAAFLVWVVAGLATHQMYSHWLLNVVRVAAPFLIGWFVVAPFTGAYRLPPPSRRIFLARSALAWLASIAIGLALRATLFGSGFVPIFALVTIVVTAVFVLGWRAAFAFLLDR